MHFRPDLAANAPWRTSSTLSGWAPSGRGASPRAVEPRVFFHTLSEPSPWIEFDLGAPRSVGFVAAVNRSDCCAGRAVHRDIHVNFALRAAARQADRAEVHIAFLAQLGPDRAGLAA